MSGPDTSKRDLELRCDELVGLVTEYLEGTIADAERERFELHLPECEFCERYVEQTRAVVAALGQLGEEPSDPEPLRRALEAFRQAHA